jgi:hypothetical protein
MAGRRVRGRSRFSERSRIRSVSGFRLTGDVNPGTLRRVLETFDERGAG